MFDRLQINRLKPLAAFFLTYTIVFYLFAITLRFTFPFLAGFLLAMALQPLTRMLKKRLKLGPGLASALVTLLAFVVLIGIVILLGYLLVSEISNLVVKLSEMDPASINAPINQIIDMLSSYVSNIHINSEFIQQNQEQFMKIAQTGMGVVTSILNTSLRFLTSLPAILTMFIVMVFSTYFFSKDMPRIKKQMMSLFSHATARNIRSASRHSVVMSGRLVSSYLLIYCITFLETLVVFAVLGVPYPLVLSLVAGVADILPVLGPGTVYIPLAVIFLFQGRYFTAIALVVCWMLISAIRQILEPKIVSASINIHPLCMLAAIYFSLIAKNLWVLIYMSLLFVLYQVLVKAGVLPPLFEEAEPVKKPIQPVSPAPDMPDGDAEK